MEIIGAAIGIAKLLLERANINLKRKYLEELNDCEDNLTKLSAVEYLDRDHAAIDFYRNKLCQCLRNISADLARPDAVS
jgi:hypothetical protein